MAPPPDPGDEQYPPQQGDVPPGQAQYPPQQGDLPPGQAQYPPQQGDVPPGQAQYPPQQGDLPPGEAQYPPQQGDLPPGEAQYPPQQTVYPSPQVSPEPEAPYPPQQTVYPSPQVVGGGPGSIVPWLAVIAVLAAVAAGVVVLVTGGDDGDEAAPTAPSAPPAAATTVDAGEPEPDGVTLTLTDDLWCFAADADPEVQVCAAPVGAVLDELGETSEEPALTGVTPEQAAALIAISGGSPDGAIGFTALVVDGPADVSLGLPADPADVTVPVVVVDGVPVVGSSTFVTPTADVAVDPVDEGAPSPAGEWQDESGGGTLVCSGFERAVPAAPVGVVTIAEADDGTLTVSGAPELDGLAFAVTGDDTWSAPLRTMPDGTPVSGEVTLSLVSADRLEGEVRTEPSQGCSFERSLAMTRVGGAPASSAAPLELDAAELFVTGPSFVAAWDGCDGGCLSGDASSGSTLLDHLVAPTFDPVSAFLPGFPPPPGSDGAAMDGKPIQLGLWDGRPVNLGLWDAGPLDGDDQGSVMVDGKPIQLGLWDARPDDAPTMVPLVPVEAVGVVRPAEFDAWFVLGVGDAGAAAPTFGGERVRFYALDPVAGVQTALDTTVDEDALSFAVDRNAVVVGYVFGSAEAAAGAPASWPSPL